MQRVIIAAFLLFAGISATWAQSAKEILKKGETFYLSKKYTQALEVYLVFGENQPAARQQAFLEGPAALGPSRRADLAVRVGEAH